MRMKISEEILKLVPYKPGKPIAETKREYGLQRVVKLASNENPLGVSPKVAAALRTAITDLHRYPDAACFELKQKFSQKYQMPMEQISFGNGSNEIIDLLIRLFCLPGDKILTAESAFIAYKICAQVSRVETVEVPLDGSMRFDLSALLQRLRTEDSRPKLVFLPNPNNPTGTYVGDGELRDFLHATQEMKDVMVVYDEAYCEYVRAADYPNGLDLLRDFDHVIVIRTLSKDFGIAGLRLGVLFASTWVVDLYDRIRNPFNVNSLAQVAAAAALDDEDYTRKSREIVWAGLDYFYKELSQLGLQSWPSQANFVLFDTGRDAAKMDEALLREGVIMRPVKGYGLPTHLRLSVGLPEENEFAIQALKRALQMVTV